MESPLSGLLINVRNYFVKTPIQDSEKITNLVRIHSEKLTQFGDVSFPYKNDIWIKYLRESDGQLNEEAFQLLNDDNELVENEKQKFLEVAKQWLLPVNNLIIRQERCHLYLQRGAIIEYLIPKVLRNSKYGQLKKAVNKYVYLKKLSEKVSEENLSFYRSKLLYNVLAKILVYSSWQVMENKDYNLNETSLELNVCSVASKICKKSFGCGVIIKCGLVTDPTSNGKLCQLSTQEYIGMRSNDMTLMALHKYGIRVQQVPQFCALMERLGSAAVTVDLLEVKHTSPVQVIRSGQGCTKGASFILYNSARLETILRTFQERIDLGEYDPLPSIDNIQWKLLNEEEEWELAFVYIAGFPDLIRRCLEQLERGLCSTHLIIRFLHGLVATFSVYYRRIRILTEEWELAFVYIAGFPDLIRRCLEQLERGLCSTHLIIRFLHGLVATFSVYYRRIRILTEEWELAFVYIAGFPDLIRRCLEQLERGLCSTHLIIRFLHGLVATFSVYYRRIRILTEKRDHLMPYVYVRIYLIKAVREILNKVLALLDIEPVKFM